MLAGIPSAPIGRDPYLFPHSAFLRVQEVLQQMRLQGYITAQQERLAVQHFYLTLAMPQVVVEFAEGPDARPRPGRVLLVRPGLAATVAAGAELLFSTAAWEALPPEMRRLVERESEFGARAGYFGGEWTIGARAGGDTDDEVDEPRAWCACGAD